MLRISILVPVRNEAAAIRGTLTALLNQDYPSFEVLVADGGSEDATVSIVRELQAEHPNLKLFFNPKRLASAARNLGVRHMSGDVAVVVDGHCHVPDAGYLSRLANAMRESGAETLGRPQPQGIDDPNPFQRAVSIARASRLGHNPDSDIYNSHAKFVEPQSTAVVYRREVFETVGLFDERFDACEDVEFNTRVHAAGFRCFFTPDLQIVYHPRSTLAGLSKQLMRYGTGRVKLARKHPQSLTLPALVPPLWLAWLGIGAVLSVLWTPLLWLYLGSLALYAAVILGGSLWLSRGQAWTVKARMPAVFLGIHGGFGWGALRECITPNNPAPSVRCRLSGRRWFRRTR